MGDTKKPRRAGALRGMMLKLSGLGVSEVLDLNCDCSVTALFIGSDNDSCLCPLGVELHAIVAGFDLAKLLSDQIDKARHETSSLIVCRQGNSHILLCRVDTLDIKINGENAKRTGFSLDSCIQQFCSFFIELAVILDLAIVVTQRCSRSPCPDPAAAG